MKTSAVILRNTVHLIGNTSISRERTSVVKGKFTSIDSPILGKVRPLGHDFL